MKTSSIVVTFCVLPLTFLTVTACSKSGSGAGEPNKMAGYWIEEFDAKAIEQLTTEDGSCSPYSVSDSDDLGHYYLEVNRIDNLGNLFDVATVSKDTPSTGDFYKKGHIDGDGKLTLNQSFEDKWKQAGLTFKEYEHFFRLESDDVLVNEIKKQVVIHNGETSTMENSTSKFFKITEEEFIKTVAFAKDCAAKQTLAP